LLRVRLDSDIGRETGLQFPDVRFVHQGANLDLLEVGHPHQHRATGKVARARDDLTLLDRSLDDRARDRGAERDVVQLIFRQLEVGGGSDACGPGVGVLEHGRLELLIRDDIGIMQLADPAELSFGHFEPGLRDVEIGLRLLECVPHIARVDAREERALLDIVSKLDRQLENLAACLRLHLDDPDGLDGPGGVHARDDGLFGHGGRLQHAHRLVGRPLAAGNQSPAREQNAGDQQRTLDASEGSVDLDGIHVKPLAVHMGIGTPGRCLQGCLPKTCIARRTYRHTGRRAKGAGCDSVPSHPASVRARTRHVERTWR
jgi:hypothetical protein